VNEDVHRSLAAAEEDRADGNVLENKGREEESEATKPIIMVDVGKKRAKNLIRLPTRLMLCSALIQMRPIRKTTTITR